MNLVGKLKDEVEQANTPEELKQAFMNAGIELSEEELDALFGGTDLPERGIVCSPEDYYYAGGLPVCGSGVVKIGEMTKQTFLQGRGKTAVLY